MRFFENVGYKIVGNLINALWRVEIFARVIRMDLQYVNNPFRKN